jgi:peptidyl-prolyl cis-trans isomerase D
MLKLFSRLEKTRNFVMLLFASLMVVSLVFFYAPSRNTTVATSSQSKETIAKVGSDTIAAGEIIRQKESQERMFGGRMPAQIKNILDRSISSKIVKQEANRLGFSASDEEVASKIREQNKTEDGKQIDKKRYEQWAADNFGGVKDYEDIVREGIASQKLEAFLTAGVNVSEEEVLNTFKKGQTKLDLSFVSVNAKDIAAKITPTDAELKAYFETNKKNYFISTPQKKIRYVFVNQSKVGEKLQIPEADLKTEYDALPIDRKQAGVQVQQIVLRVSKPELDSQVLTKGTELVTDLKKDGDVVSEAKFTEIAKGQSEDPKSAANGGKIAGLVKSNPNNPTDPLQRTLTIKDGEITEPIKFGSSYYIFRRMAAVSKTFEDAKKEIEVSLRNRRSYTATAEVAQKVAARLKEVKDVQKVADEFAGQVNMSAKDMVRETAYVTKDDDIPNIGVSPQFEEGIAPLQNVNDTGEKIPVKDGFAIPLLVDKKDPRDATFDEVKTKVAEVVKNEQASAKLETIAKEIASGVTGASELSAIASGKGLKAEESKGFTLGAPLGKGESAATSKELEDAILALKVGETTKTPIKAGDNYYIVGVTKKDEGKMDEFAKQRDQLMQSAMFSKRGQVFEDYLADAKGKLEAAGQIKIYKEVIDKLEAEIAADAKANPPQQ